MIKWNQLFSINAIKRRFFAGPSNEPLVNRLIKNFSIGFIGSLILALIGIGRTALLTKSISIETVGKIFIILNLFELLSSFFSVRVNDLLFRFYPQFKSEQNKGALQGLLYLSLLLSLTIGLLISFGVFVSAPWFCEKFYDNKELANSFRIFAPVMLFSNFQGFYTTILRLHDRFSCVVVPQIFGTLITFTLLVFYFLMGITDYKIEWVIVFFALGTIAQSLIPLVISLRITSPVLKRGKDFSVFSHLRPYKKKLISNLFHTNLVGYLKVASDTGGLFLLGILSAPTQVAYFGIAKQITTPLKMIKNNFQNAIAPEIVQLWSEKHLSKLYELIKKILLSSITWGGVSAILLIVFAKPLLMLLTTNAYFPAIPTIYLLIAASYLNFISTVFYPLTVAMDYMPRRNFVVSFRLIFLGLGVLYGLNAFVLGIVHLLGVIFTRIFADFPLMRRLRNESSKEKFVQFNLLK